MSCVENKTTLKKKKKKKSMICESVRAKRNMRMKRGLVLKNWERERVTVMSLGDMAVNSRLPCFWSFCWIVIWIGLVTLQLQIFFSIKFYILQLNFFFCCLVWRELFFFSNNFGLGSRYNKNLNQLNLFGLGLINKPIQFEL